MIHLQLVRLLCVFFPPRRETSSSHPLRKTTFNLTNPCGKIKFRCALFLSKLERCLHLTPKQWQARRQSQQTTAHTNLHAQKHCSLTHPKHMHSETSKFTQNKEKKVTHNPTLECVKEMMSDLFIQLCSSLFSNCLAGQITSSLQWVFALMLTMSYHDLFLRLLWTSSGSLPPVMKCSKRDNLEQIYTFRAEPLPPYFNSLLFCAQNQATFLSCRARRCWGAEELEPDCKGVQVCAGDCAFVLALGDCMAQPKRSEKYKLKCNSSWWLLVLHTVFFFKRPGAATLYLYPMGEVIIISTCLSAKIQGAAPAPEWACLTSQRQFLVSLRRKRSIFLPLDAKIKACLPPQPWQISREDV